MRLSCLQDNMRRALGIVGSAVATKSNMPIMQNVYMGTDRARVKIVGSSDDLTITTWIGAKVDEEGAVTIPARLLSDYVNSLPDERIDMAYVESPEGVRMECENFTAEFHGLPASDYPNIPTVDSGVACEIEAEDLAEAVNHVCLAAATEDSRPVLTGVKVEISGDSFTFAAADGFRLAVFYGSLTKPVEEDLEFIIPARTLREVARLIGDQSGAVQFTVTPERNQAGFRLTNIEVVGNLLQGTFPNFKQLVPEKYDTRVLVNRQQFLSATRTASIIARDSGSNIIRLMMEKEEGEENGKLKVIAKGDDVGEITGVLEVNVEGPDAKIAYNGRYITDVLTALDSNQVALETTSPSSPGVIKPVGDDSYVHVVMPIFVQW